MQRHRNRLIPSTTVATIKMLKITEGHYRSIQVSFTLSRGSDICSNAAY